MAGHTLGLLEESEQASGYSVIGGFESQRTHHSVSSGPSSEATDLYTLVTPIIPWAKPTNGPGRAFYPPDDSKDEICIAPRCGRTAKQGILGLTRGPHRCGRCGGALCTEHYNGGSARRIPLDVNAVPVFLDEPGATQDSHFVVEVCPICYNLAVRRKARRTAHKKGRKDLFKLPISPNIEFPIQLVFGSREVFLESAILRVQQLVLEINAFKEEYDGMPDLVIAREFLLAKGMIIIDKFERELRDLTNDISQSLKAAEGSESKIRLAPVLAMYLADVLIVCRDILSWCDSAKRNALGEESNEILLPEEDYGRTEKRVAALEQETENVLSSLFQNNQVQIPATLKSLVRLAAVVEHEYMEYCQADATPEMESFKIRLVKMLASLCTAYSIKQSPGTRESWAAALKQCETNLFSLIERVDAFTTAVSAKAATTSPNPREANFLSARIRETMIRLESITRASSEASPAHASQSRDLLADCSALLERVEFARHTLLELRITSRGVIDGVSLNTVKISTGTPWDYDPAGRGYGGAIPPPPKSHRDDSIPTYQEHHQPNPIPVPRNESPPPPYARSSFDRVIAPGSHAVERDFYEL